MFNPVGLVIEAYVERLKAEYVRMYGIQEPHFPGLVAFVGRLALENLANSDAAYHNLDHTILVTEVGQQILRGKHILEGGVRPCDWLHFTVALLCHDIGFLRGVCPGDGDGEYVTGAEGERVRLPRGATDAALAPYHVDRSQLFVGHRFGNVELIDARTVAGLIERTRFPVPDEEAYRPTEDYPGLLRAGDLIGQLADPNYMRKSAALFAEFQETGASAMLGYRSPADLRANYPKFFWGAVRPFVGPALRFLQVTQEGKQTLANLYAHVFAEEHQALALGPERGEAVEGGAGR
jgi:hypothetical protein